MKFDNLEDLYNYGQFCKICKLPAKLEDNHTSPFYNFSKIHNQMIFKSNCKNNSLDNYEFYINLDFIVDSVNNTYTRNIVSFDCKTLEIAEKLIEEIIFSHDFEFYCQNCQSYIFTENFIFFKGNIYNFGIKKEYLNFGKYYLGLFYLINEINIEEVQKSNYDRYEKAPRFPMQKFDFSDKESVLRKIQMLLVFQ